MKTEKYFTDLKENVDEIYSVATLARKKGLDPVDEVEIPLAMSMAEKVVGLISTLYPQMMNSGIAQRILDLEVEYGKLDPTVVFKIGEEVAEQKFCKFESILEAIDAGIRVGFAYFTLGVVSSPIEGYTGIKVAKTKEGKDYLVASFSGPIRSAGTTSTCIALMLIDFLREKFGYAKYDPTPNEVRRIWTELSDFHDRITNLQYMPTEEETLFLAQHLPIQIAGDASEKLEVSNYKNLERVDTNYLRSGVCLVMAEGLAQKGPKAYRLYKQARENGIQATGFDWMDEYIELVAKKNKNKGKKSKGVPTYIKDLVAGRPIYGHPSRSGAFRFRYGRGRNAGFSASNIHPATMGISDDFIANGTQLKLENPTKGCVVTSCSVIEGPIVKLKNGSVRQLTDVEEARKLYKDTEEIVYFGDMLFPFSDVANRNAMMLKPGYVEEWWNLELKEKGGSLAPPGVPQDIGGNEYNVGFEEAVKLSEEYKIPFYPKFIYYWTQISSEEFLELINWFGKGHFDEKFILPWTKKDTEVFEKGKRALELLGVPHEVTLENVVVDKKNALALLFNLGIGLEKLNEKFLFQDVFDKSKVDFEKSVLENVNNLCSFEIKDKAGDFIGSRMGRPEKVKLRKLIGSPNALFSVGSEGGRLRSVEAACGVGKIRASFPMYDCEDCGVETIYKKCENCGKEARQKFYFTDVREKAYEEKIENSDKVGLAFSTKEIDVNHYYKKALEHLGMERREAPALIKGIRGTASAEKVVENLAKGILRAKNDLQVNKDGTIRMDATELPFTQFRPKEILTSIEKLKELGYDKDIYGKDLVSDDQLIEVMPHDVLIPHPRFTPDEKGGDIFIKICNFVDDLLVKFYGLNPYYNVKKKEDLIGKLGVCMAPHNCAGVICRFIGFSDTLGMMASPYMHAAIRRDCDGDEAALMLLGDVLLNFSRKFLPSHRGGTQDAPLVLNAKIDAGEVDDQILDFEVLYEYPLELYRLAEQGVHSSKVKVNMIRDVLKKGDDPFVGIGFTHDTDNFNDGVICSSYKTLATMQEKVDHQMALVEKIRAVDQADVARLIIERHFIRDMRGNLRSFSTQGFRCVACNEIVRRPPLSGVCPVCRGKLIFTIHEGGIKKYLEPAILLAKKYNLSHYLQQNLKLIKGYIDSIFGKETEKQEKLEEWF